MPYDVEMKVEPGHLVVRAKGAASLPDNIDFGIKVLKACKDHDREKVIVDIRELGKPTSITEAYELGHEVAPLTIGLLKKVAILHGVERSEHQTFFQTTMRNRGINLCAFLDESKAVAWLLDDTNDEICLE